MTNSFSESKQFEIPLYKGNPLRPVTFESAGAVPIACNIHDWMKAYIYVVNTDKFTLTDTLGNGSINNLLNGEYEVVVWHPNMGSDAPTKQKVNLDGSDQQLTFNVIQKPPPRGGGRRLPKSRNRRTY